MHNLKKCAWKISFHQSHGGNFTKEFEITPTKQKVPNNNDVVMCTVQVTTMSSSDQNKEENWLIASNTQQLQQKHGTASVSIKLEVNKVTPVKGECFSFYPSTLKLDYQYMLVVILLS